MLFLGYQFIDVIPQSNLEFLGKIMKHQISAITVAILLSGCLASQPPQPKAVRVMNAVEDVASVSIDDLDEQCLGLLTALKGCQQGPAGPFGVYRTACETGAEAQFECALETDTLRTLLSF